MGLNKTKQPTTCQLLSHLLENWCSWCAKNSQSAHNIWRQCVNLMELYNWGHRPLLLVDELETVYSQLHTFSATNTKAHTPLSPTLLQICQSYIIESLLILHFWFLARIVYFTVFLMINHSTFSLFSFPIHFLSLIFHSLWNLLNVPHIARRHQQDRCWSSQWWPRRCRHTDPWALWIPASESPACTTEQGLLSRKQTWQLWLLRVWYIRFVPWNLGGHRCWRSQLRNRSTRIPAGLSCSDFLVDKGTVWCLSWGRRSCTVRCGQLSHSELSLNSIACYTMKQCPSQQFKALQSQLWSIFYKNRQPKDMVELIGRFGWMADMFPGGVQPICTVETPALIKDKHTTTSITKSHIVGGSQSILWRLCHFILFGSCSFPSCFEGIYLQLMKSSDCQETVMLLGSVSVR